eukprot:14965417-Ditylum_brightwellii.AAC.1
MARKPQLKSNEKKNGKSDTSTQKVQRNKGKEQATKKTCDKSNLKLKAKMTKNKLSESNKSDALIKEL